MNSKVRRDYTRMIANDCSYYPYRFLPTHDQITTNSGTLSTNSTSTETNLFEYANYKILSADYQYFADNLHLGKVFAIDPIKNIKLDSLNNSFCFTDGIKTIIP